MGSSGGVERMRQSMRVCNNCPQLSITEKEQDRLRSMGIEKFHICYRYGKRVFHWSNGKYHDPNIYPCSECINENKN